MLLPLGATACSSSANTPTAAPASAVQPFGNSQTAANKALVTTFYDQLFLRFDTDAVGKYVSPDYKQHNPTAADGPGALRGLVLGIKAHAPASQTTIEHVIAQGDLVLIHHWSQNSPGDTGTAIADIFRVTNGKISEHWDALQSVPATTASGNDMFRTLSQPPPADGPPTTDSITATDSTGSLVRSYFAELNANRDLTAIDRYVSSTLYEHDPSLARGSAALRSAYANRFAEVPQSSASSPLFVTEGDFAAVRYHYQSTPADRGLAVTEMFRVQDGKIVERWTVSQPVPATSANRNTMF
jgi:predicted SnoaL-like aldol condensation-catalyzing enzyme